MREGSAAGRPMDPAKDVAILEAATHLLYRIGPHAVTMESVARAAGVSKPTLYRRYTTRDELIAATVQRKAAQLLEEFVLDPTSFGDVEAALLQFGQTLLEFILGPDHVNFVHAIAGSNELPSSVTDAIFRHGPDNTRRRLATWLGNAHKKSLLNCPKPDYSAELFIGMLLGMHLVRSVYRAPKPLATSALRKRVRQVVHDFVRLHDPGQK